MIFPNASIGDDIDLLDAFCAEVEACGFDHVQIFDHVLGAPHHDRHPPLEGPYTDADPFHEPLTLAAYIAARTRRVGLSTGVLVLPQRQAALVAKQAAEVQILSRGRLRLGVGTGWNHVEYRALGASWTERGAVFDEQLEVLRRLWTEPLVEVTGTHHRIDRAGILPRPPDQIPLWFGGFSAVQQRRAARVGSGFIWRRVSSLSRRGVAETRRLIAAAGGDPAAFGADVLIDASTSQIAAQVAEWERSGGTHVSITLNAPGSGLMSEVHNIAELLGLVPR